MDKEQFHKELLAPLSQSEKRTTKSMMAAYKEVSGKVMLELSDMYMKLETDGELSFADVNRYRDLDKVLDKIFVMVSELSVNNRNAIDKFLYSTYEYSYSWLSTAIENEIGRKLLNNSPQLADWVAASQNNPITGLRLDPAMERSRGLIIGDIRDTITEGIKSGKRYSSIAKDMQEVFNADFNRTLRIARTEVHRVRETATSDSATNAHKQGIRMQKTWNNMKDASVRETKKANHVKMEGQTVDADAVFILGEDGNEITAMSPGQSGDASNDINCRCFATYSIKAIEKV